MIAHFTHWFVNGSCKQCGCSRDDREVEMQCSHRLPRLIEVEEGKKRFYKLVRQ